MPSQLNITLTTSGNPTVVVPISAALQSLDSGQLAATQSGYDGSDQAVRNIFKAGVFFVPSNSTWYSAFVIESITAS